MNPNDGPMRKRKQELEDTLTAVKKKKLEVHRPAPIYRSSYWL